ncbi:MAG: DUF3857 domain-containing protein [Bacteroidetes bacterium]|nr:DUF3857 domain-containing protein [Bacteroidota bacterium]
MNLKKRIFIFLYLSFITPYLIGQQVDKELELYKSIYPDEDAITILHSTSIEITLKNNKPIITESAKEQSLLLTKRSAVLNTAHVGYSFFNKVIEYEAFTLVPVDNKYKKMEVKDIEDFKEDNNSIFYDDSKVKKFIFPGLIQGAKTYLSYTIQHNEPWLWGNYIFTNGGSPVEDMDVSLVFPDKVKIVWKVINDDSSKISFTEIKKGKKTIYQWKAHKLPKIKFEDNGPNYKWYTPILMIGIAEYIDDDNNTVKMMGSHKSLYKWYRKMIDNSKNEVIPEMKAIVDSLISPNDSEKEKVKKIYYWSQQNISYVAFEDGYAGFTPGNSQDVFTKRYGDCKGKANLLKALLGIANIKSYLTWIGTTHLPYKRDDIPGKPVDNHMIVTYIGVDGKYYFLDPTDDFISMEFPTSFIQGKEAFIALSDTDYKIVTVPEIESARNTISDAMTIKIDKTKLIGSGNVTSHGYNHFLIANSFKTLPYDKQKLIFYNIFNKGNNKFILDTLTVINFNSPDSNVQLIYNYTIPDYITKMNDKIFVNLNLDKLRHYKNINCDDRQCGVFWQYKEILDFKYQLEIPAGYTVESIPPDSYYDNPEFGYKIKYTQINNQIILEKKLYSAFHLLEKSKIPIWNAMIKTFDKSVNQSVVLKKNN